MKLIAGESPSELNHHHPGSYHVTSLSFVYPSRISVFSSGEATNELQMLLKTVRYTLGNLQTCLEIKQPNEVKFKRLRKGNPPIKRKILNFTAAIEILPWLALWKRLYRKAEEHRNVMTQASCGLPKQLVFSGSVSSSVSDGTVRCAQLTVWRTPIKDTMVRGLVWRKNHARVVEAMNCFIMVESSLTVICFIMVETMICYIMVE
ncbi:Uncharacterized protein Rs2_00605 [Raphanus sativus]|nr:Uncharacterized protein Rs2_00605 [Raphanus sativus]